MKTTYYMLAKLLMPLTFCSFLPLVSSHGGETKGAPTEILRNEHDLIRKMSAFAGKTAMKIQDEKKVDWKELARLLDFFKNFADQCHHAKEEKFLFPELKKLNVDPVVVDLLIKQHEEGRILMGGIADMLNHGESTLSDSKRQSLAEYLSQYSQLMERHVKLENEYLWPMASETLDDSAKDRLTMEFERVEKSLGDGFHEKYHSMAMKLLNGSGSSNNTPHPHQ